METNVPLNLRFLAATALSADAVVLDEPTRNLLTKRAAVLEHRQAQLSAAKVS